MGDAKSSGEDDYRDLNLEIEHGDKKYNLRIVFDRETAGSAVYANVSKFTWMGGEILLELGRLDPVKYHMLMERLKTAIKANQPLPDLEMGCDLVARVHLSTGILPQLAKQCNEVVASLDRAATADDSNDESE